MRRALLCLALLLIGGCAYYNGMYNAKRLAGRARKAEREGRTFDATSLWGQVGVKAESVLAQHPNSKWADEARLLQATSMAKLRNCALAVQPLEAVVLTSPNPAFREDAALLLGSCRTQLGDPAGAMIAYSRLTTSHDPERRRLARFAHGRAQRIDGNYQAALEELTGNNYPGAAGERAAALAGLGRLPEASALVDSLLTARDTLVPWDSLLAAASRHDPEAASNLIDRIAADSALPLPLRCRLLLADVVRWRGQDLARSDARLAKLEQLAAGNVRTADFRLEALRLRVREAETLQALNPWIARLEEIGEGSGTAEFQASRLAGAARRVVQAGDSVSPGAPGGDLRLFLAAEIARDSLEAPAIATSQFQRVVTEWPQSPFTPKAILALIVLEPARADSLRDLLRANYGGSPYVALIDSGASPEYEALEDSLRRFAASFRPEGRSGPVSAPIRRDDRPAPAPRQPVNR